MAVTYSAAVGSKGTDRGTKGKIVKKHFNQHTGAAKEERSVIKERHAEKDLSFAAAAGAANRCSSRGSSSNGAAAATEQQLRNRGAAQGRGDWGRPHSSLPGAVTEQGNFPKIPSTLNTSRGGGARRRMGARPGGGHGSKGGEGSIVRQGNQTPTVATHTGTSVLGRTTLAPPFFIHYLNII